jgi:hypothetical protein
VSLLGAATIEKSPFGQRQRKTGMAFPPVAAAYHGTASLSPFRFAAEMTRERRRRRLGVAQAETDCTGINAFCGSLAVDSVEVSKKRAMPSQANAEAEPRPDLSAEEVDEVIGRDVNRAQNAPKGAAVQSLVHRHRDGAASVTYEAHVTASLARLAVAELGERRDALLA